MRSKPLMTERRWMEWRWVFTAWSRNNILPSSPNIPGNDGRPSLLPSPNEVLRATKQIFYFLSSTSLPFLSCFLLVPLGSRQRYSNSPPERKERLRFGNAGGLWLNRIYFCHHKALWNNSKPLLIGQNSLHNIKWLRNSKLIKIIFKNLVISS
jgi:hypothetical protein